LAGAVSYNLRIDLEFLATHRQMWDLMVFWW